MKKTLGVDFDDVIFRCDKALEKFHNTRYGTEYVAEERTTFTLEPVWNCSPEEVQRRLDEFSESEFHENADAVFGAREALERLNAAYDIAIVTGRADNSRDATVKWLEKNLFGLYREIHFANHRYGDPRRRRSKSEILKELGVEVFVEDALHFAEDVAASGITVFLFDMPWNRHETPEGAIRVHSWDEVVSRLLA